MRGEVRRLTVFVYKFPALFSGRLVNSAEEKKMYMIMKHMSLCGEGGRRTRIVRA